MRRRKERFNKLKQGVQKRINPRAWSGYDYIKDSTSSALQGARRLFFPSPMESGYSYTFDEAVELYNVTPEKLRKKCLGFLRLTVLAIFLSILMFIYAITELIFGHFLSFFPSFVVSLLCLAIAFKYHFWYFQIKTKKLGCSVHEWLEYILPSKK